MKAFLKEHLPNKEVEIDEIVFQIGEHFQNGGYSAVFYAQLLTEMTPELAPIGTATTKWAFKAIVPEDGFDPWQEELEMNRILSGSRHLAVAEYVVEGLDCDGVLINGFFMKLYEADLYDTDDFDLSSLSIYFRGVCEGVERLHNMGYIHMDIKPENIFIESDGTAALADFGLVENENNYVDNYVDKCYGSRSYAAPECAHAVLEDKPWCFDGKKLDIWAIGVSLYLKVVYEYPHGHRKSPSWHDIADIDPEYLRDNLEDAVENMEPEYMRNDMVDFTLRCLELDPEARPTIQELLEHPFLPFSKPMPPSLPDSDSDSDSEDGILR